MLQFQVQGMSCGHCVKAVTQAVQSAYPQARVEVDLGAGKVRVDQAGDAARIAQLIAEAGYTVSGSETVG
ncbi:heavy-metal-associated domain-containing protein [Pigmentiphaga sp.]|uniref:heavy-metal-associated domain-containing protein n=1 Tax=Pigmentiphaga sp. TaxID=1977564 RepID=UPI00128C2EE5|nr:heavy-metal-associated domain-containing protein [Pigmentiphaga sp.]MPS25826.1 copper chaperone [Alcaligenaceae bacterium SAGV5]MPS53308.1 copper chaperone [Alcaligenaceae bacterium SAGV3]MPT58918.1 copper chaperone [Alcaligenaceae bacterium]